MKLLLALISCCALGLPQAFAQQQLLSTEEAVALTLENNLGIKVSSNQR